MHTFWQLLSLVALAWCLWRRHWWLRQRELLLIYRTSTPDRLYDYRMAAMCYTLLSVLCLLWIHWVFVGP